jgi:hypothetical protein
MNADMLYRGTEDRTPSLSLFLAHLTQRSGELLPSLGVRRPTVFELLPKTCNFTICSIFSNSGHVGWCTASPDTILTLETLVMIQTKFGFHWSSTFRGEDF